MRTIRKITLDSTTSEAQSVTIQADLRVIQLGSDNGDPTIWAEIESIDSTETINFYLLTPGSQIPDDSSFIGCIIITPYTWCVYKES